MAQEKVGVMRKVVWPWLEWPDWWICLCILTYLGHILWSGGSEGEGGKARGRGRESKREREREEVCG